MSWTHLVTGYAPGVGTRIGSINVTSAATGTLTAPSLRLGDIFVSNAKFLQQGLPIWRDALISLTGGNVRGLRFQVPNVIVRFGPVTGATLSGTTLTLTIGSGHNIQTGEALTIRNVLGSTEINGSYAGSRVKRTSDTVVTITGIAAITAFSTSAASIVEVIRPFASISMTSFVPATKLFTTAAVHGLNPGDKVFISQITGLTFTGPTWQNRPVTVATTPLTTTFTINENIGVSGTSSGGNVTAIRTVNNYGLIKVIQSRVVGIASITAADPAVYTTSEAHGFAVGDRVAITGVQGTTVGALNVPGVVRTVPTSTTLTVESEAGVPVTGAAATITAATGYIATTGPTNISTLVESLPWAVQILNNPAKDGLGTGPFNL